MDTGVFVLLLFFLQKVKLNHTNCLNLHNVFDEDERIFHSKLVCETLSI